VTQFAEHYSECHEIYETRSMCCLAAWGCGTFFKPTDVQEVLTHFTYEAAKYNSLKASGQLPTGIVRKILEWHADVWDNLGEAFIQDTKVIMVDRDSIVERYPYSDKRRGAFFDGYFWKPFLGGTACAYLTARVRHVSRRLVNIHNGADPTAAKFTVPQGRFPILDPSPYDWTNLQAQNVLYEFLEHSGRAEFEFEGCWNTWVLPQNSGNGLPTITQTVKADGHHLTSDNTSCLTRITGQLS
jgi:hypothetical protein